MNQINREAEVLSKQEQMLMIRDNVEWEIRGAGLCEQIDPWQEEEIRAVQSRVPCEGEMPTPEELIGYLSSLVRDLMKEFGWEEGAKM